MTFDEYVEQLPPEYRAEFDRIRGIVRSMVPDAEETISFSDDGDTITGRWEIAEDGASFATDFDLVYRRALPSA